MLVAGLRKKVFVLLSTLFLNSNRFQSSANECKKLDISPKTTADRIAEHGYPVEKHDIHTEDGYINTVFRIPYSHNLRNQDERRPIVVLQHGIFSSSDSWVLIGPENGLPFLLSDAGFDVWLGNTRGNTYAQKHERFSTKQSEFWRFTTHEMGYYDLPALIDYALTTNNGDFESVYYVGYSQGTTEGFIMLATRTEYARKIKIAHMLAPVTFLRHMQGALNLFLTQIFGKPNLLTSLLSNHEIFPGNELFSIVSYNACDETSPINGLCLIAFNSLQGDPRNLNRTAKLYMFQTHPTGISTNQILHASQLKISGRFCQYDLGAQRNRKKYGQPTPPDYNLTALTTIFHLWYGDNDAFATKEDVQKLISLLPNRILHHIPDPNWDHLDFILANELLEYIHEPLVESLRKAERL